MNDRRIIVIGNPSDDFISTLGEMAESIIVFKDNADLEQFKKQEKFSQLTFNIYKSFSESKDSAGKILTRNGINNYNDLENEYKLILAKKASLGIMQEIQ